jgi:hypothetical protein
MPATASIARPIIEFATVAVILSVFASAQDSRYVPESFAEQLLNSPPCLTIRMPWEGENFPCTAFTHQEWLTDLNHWRNERRIRIGYDPARYSLPALEWTCEFHTAADDGARPVFLRSRPGQIHGRPLS